MFSYLFLPLHHSTLDIDRVETHLFIYDQELSDDSYTNGECCFLKENFCPWKFDVVIALDCGNELYSCTMCLFTVPNNHSYLYSSYPYKQKKRKYMYILSNSYVDVNLSHSVPYIRIVLSF